MGNRSEIPEDKERRLLESLLEECKAGRITKMEAARRVEESSPGSVAASLLLSRGAVEELAREAITVEESERVVSRQADLHPAVPELFVDCAVVSSRREPIEDVPGYFALAKIKSELYIHSEFLEDVLSRDEGTAPLIELVEEAARSLSVWRHYGDRHRDHLAAHFLVQDVASAEERYLDPDEVEEVVIREDRLGPLLAAMCYDLTHIEKNPPSSWVFIARLLGELKPPEAVSSMIEALEICGGELLHEAVLTLAKLGSAHPAPVSHRLKELAGDQEGREARLPAIEVLGFLFREEGNLDFLEGALQSLDSKDPEFDELFKFLTWSLLKTGLSRESRLVSESIDARRAELSRETVKGVRRSLAAFMAHDDRFLEDLLLENIHDLCCGPLSDETRSARLTMTLIREMAISGELGRMLEEKSGMEPVPPEFLEAGRNDPCPCGSGRKFKKCCLRKVERGRTVHAARATGEEEADLDEIMLLMEAVMTFSKANRFRSEARAAAAEFLSSSGRKHFEVLSDDEETSTEHNLFIDWFLLTRPLSYSGKTILEEFWEQRGAMLPDGIRDLAKGLMDSRFSVYEVQEVFPEEGLILRDLFRRDTVRVREKLATRSLVRWDMAAVRVGPVGGHYEMLRTPFRVPREFKEKVVRYVKRKCRELENKGEVDGMDGFLQLKGYTLFNYVSRLADKKPPPVLLTAEGDMMCLCSAVFDLKDRNAATRILEENPYIEEEYHGVPAKSTGPRRYAWLMSPGMENDLRSGSHIGDPQTYGEAVGWEKPRFASAPEEEDDGQIGQTRRFLGSITITGKRLVFETDSRERLGRARDELLGMMPGLLVHRVDAIEDQDAILEEIVKEHDTEGAAAGGTGRGGGPAPGRPPTRIYEELAGQLERHYKDWPDHPLPALGGRTPREAVRTKAGRRKVDDLLKDFENMAESGPSDGHLAYDFSILRDELGVWPEGLQQSGDRDTATGPAAYRVQGEWSEEPGSKPLLPGTRLVPALNKLPAAWSKGICVELGLPVLSRAEDRVNAIAGFLQRHGMLEGVWKRLPKPSRRVLRWLVEQGGFAAIEELTGVFGLNRDDSRDKEGATVTPLGLLRLNGLVYIGETDIGGARTRIAAVPVELRRRLELIAGEDGGGNGPTMPGSGPPWRWAGRVGQ